MEARRERWKSNEDAKNHNTSITRAKIYFIMTTIAEVQEEWKWMQKLPVQFLNTVKNKCKVNKKVQGQLLYCNEWSKMTQEWNEWMRVNGCTVIVKVTHNEILHGNSSQCLCEWGWWSVRRNTRWEGTNWLTDWLNDWLTDCAYQPRQRVDEGRGREAAPSSTDKCGHPEIMEKDRIS